MAKNEINLTIKVTEKGNLKVIGQKAEKAAAGLDKAGKSARTADRNLKGAAQASANSTKNFSKMAQGISGGIVPAYATLAAQVFAVSAAFNFLKDAGSLRLLQEGQVAYAAATGTSLRGLTKDIQAATEAQLGFRDAAQAAAIGSAAGLDPSQITQIAKAAKDASTVLGRDLTDSFNRLVRGITKAEPELLDELGIILRLEEATKNYKRSLNIQGELTAFQRSQAVANEVLTQAEEKYGKLLEATGGGANEFAKLSTAFEDIVNQLRDFAVKFLTPIATTLQQFPELIALAFAPFGAQIIGAALPGLENLGKSLDSLGDRSKAAADKAGQALKESLGKDELVKNSAFLQATLKKEVAENAKVRLKDVDAHKRSLLQKLKDGKQLSDAQIIQVRKNLQNQVRGYKIANKQIRGEIYRTLNEMERANKLATKKIEGAFAVMSVKVKGYISSIGVTSKKVFASMVGFATRAAGAISFALSAISWVSLIASLGALAFSFFRAGEEAEDSGPSYDYLTSKLENLGTETEEFIKVQNILNDSFEYGNRVLEAFGKRLANVSTIKLSESLNVSELNKIQEAIAGTRLEAQKALPRARDMTMVEGDQLQTNLMIAGASGGMGAMSVMAGQVQLEKEYQKVKEQSTLTLSEYLDAKDGELTATEKSLKILLKDKEAIMGINNARFQSNTLVQQYLEELDKLEEGELANTAALLQRRTAIEEVAQKISLLTRLEQENSQAIANATQKVFPINEYDDLLIKMNQEVALLKEIAANYEATGEGRKLTKQEEERIAFLQNREELVRSLAETEFNAQMRIFRIDQASAALTVGKTKLVKAEIALETKLAKNAVKKYQLEQKMYQAQQVQIANAAELARIEGIAVDQRSATEKAFLASEGARRRNLHLAQAELDLLEQQTAVLERQKNELAQIGDAAAQALETGLQRNIAALIKGEESSLKDAILGIAKGILDSIADQLAAIMTSKIMKSLFKIKSPAEEMAEAMTKAAKSGGTTIQNNMESAGKTVATDIENAMKRGASGASTSVPGPGGAPIPGTGDMGCMKLCPESSLPEGLGDIVKPPTDPGLPGGDTTDPAGGAGGVEQTIFEKIGGFFSSIFEKVKSGSIFDYFFKSGAGKTTASGEGMTVEKKASGGIFGNFVDSLGRLFSGEAPFLKGLGDVFTGALGGFDQMFGDILNGIMGLFGGGGGGGGFADILGMVAGFFFAKGGYAPGGFRAFAKGGIVNKPTVGMVGEGRHNEAIVPLPDGKSIPVAMKGAGQQNNNVTVNVTVDGSGNTSQDASGDQQGMDLGKVIASAVQQELLNQKRSGGILNPYGVA